MQRERTQLFADFSHIAGLAALDLGIELPRAADTESSVQAMAERVRGGVEAGADPVVELSRLVFEDFGFEREVEDGDPRFVLLPTVMAQRRGTCVGLTQVYLAVSEQLDLDLRAVLVPGHLFVRHGRRNIELLRHGEEMPAEWYRERYGAPARVLAYMRPLSREETLAVLHYNIGNILRRKGELPAALAHYNEAVLLFDAWPEAHANRGLTLHLQGELDAARRAYLRARSLHAELPGLAANLELLARERAARRAASVSRRY
jgi:regulator of sirC expression with transglutaminase-like and TPR domain